MGMFSNIRIAVIINQVSANLMGTYCSKQQCQRKCCGHKEHQAEQFGTDEATEPYKFETYRGTFGTIPDPDNKDHTVDHRSPSGQTNEETEQNEFDGHKPKRKDNADFKRQNYKEDRDHDRQLHRQSGVREDRKHTSISKHASQGNLGSSRQMGLKRSHHRAEDYQSHSQTHRQGPNHQHQLAQSNYENKNPRVRDQAESNQRGTGPKPHEDTFSPESSHKKPIGDPNNFSIYQRLEHLDSDHSKMSKRTSGGTKKRTSSGVVYNGEWKNQLKHGHGVQTWPDGALYEGNWVDGRACGKGKFRLPNGDTYEGDFSNDMASGRGVLIREGGRFQGTWWDDLQHGNGTEIWASGSKYEGSYHKGKKQGYGRYVWADKSEYTGDWHNNMINGIGRAVWADGRKYDGEWHHNLKHGKGKHTWPDGRRYEGYYKNDKRHGHGKIVLPDGSAYAGEWAENHRHGRGLEITPDGKTREGTWENGRLKEWLN